MYHSPLLRGSLALSSYHSGDGFCVICILSLLCFPINDHTHPWNRNVWDTQLEARVGLYEVTNQNAYDYQLLHHQHAQCVLLLRASGY